MTTISNEELFEKIMGRISHLDVRDDIEYRAYEIALASLAAEPVGKVVLGEYDDCGCHPDAKAVCIAADGQAGWENFDDGARLYAASPAPVVPDEIPKGLAGQIVSLLVHNIGDKFLAQKIWYACRAAMLQRVENAESRCGNPKVSPDGWIPVSERMPEESGRYWCYVEEQNSLGKSHYQWNCSWNGQAWSDKALSGRVTHWMPLPAAPLQEVMVDITKERLLEIMEDGFLKHGESKELARMALASLAAEPAGKLHEYKPVGYQRLVDELTMLVKQLTWQLRKAKPDCKLPDKAMSYLERNGLISAEDVLR